MKNKKMKQLFCALLACALTASVVPTSVFATDSIPMTGEQTRKENQPKFSGYRVWDIRDWTPEEDPGSEFMRARIPLQKRNEQFRETQANPTLDANAEIMLMQGDYGNVFSDGMMYNNTFGYYCLNYWQYADYFSPWHGAMTATTPEDLYDRDFEDSTQRGWEKRYFEFGVLNIPNPAYTNAAHKNGVKSIACIYFDQYYRQGQTINELFIKDENGKFPVAEKLIEMAKYFGYDGYFFNAEEAVEPRFEKSKKEFLKTLEDAGLYTQYYNVNSEMNDSKAEWLKYDVDGDGKKDRIQDSVFVNYGWPNNLDRPNVNLDYIKKNNIDPFKEVFYGVEANQGGFHGGHSTTTNIEQLYAPGTKNPRASIALFTPSDYYQRAMDKKYIQDKDYQWIIDERARMYYSGVMTDPTNTGDKKGYKRPDVLVPDASKWVGVADFTSERSVIKGSNFYSNFNTGKGVQYFVNGQVSSDEEWSNINIQDIPLTWQWWLDVDGKKAPLKADFDYGKKETRRDVEGNLIKMPYTQVGAYQGGSSLAVYGEITAKNTMHLYKTDLQVKDTSKMNITFKKSSDDKSTMKLGLVFKDDAKKVVELDIKDSQTKGDWTTATVDLSKYKGKQIASINLVFDGATKNYQMNIGEIVLTDGKKAPAKPTGFEISRAFKNDEMIVNWDIADFNEVDKYEITATLSNGKKVFIGGIYDNIYYIKSLLKEQQNVKLELVAVGKNGQKSEPAVVNYNYQQAVTNLKASEEKKEVVVKPEFTVKGSVVQSSEEGALNLTWENPKVDYKNLEITVTLDDNKDKTSRWTKTVNKGEKQARIEIPKNAGEKYNVSVVTVLNDGTKCNPVNITGKLKDTTVGTYNPDFVTLKDKTLTFWCPDPNDWFKLHAKFEGKVLTFSNKFQSFGDPAPNAIRAATKMTTDIPKNTGTLEVVVEDYTGNLSKPISIHFIDGIKVTDKDLIGEEDFPDPVLRKAVQEQIGEKLLDVINFNGTLDLTNLNVQDLTGLNKLTSLKGLVLDGTKVKAIEINTLPKTLEKLSMKNMPNLTAIRKDAVKGLTKLKDVDITGSTKLRTIYLNDLALETLKTSKGSEYKDIYLLNISGNKLNLSEKSPEGQFIKEINDYVAQNPIEPQRGELQNIALGKEVTTNSFLGNFMDVGVIVDGDKAVNKVFPLNRSEHVTVNLGAKQTVEEIKIYFASETQKGEKFNIQVSDNKSDWKDVKVHNDSNKNTDTNYVLKLEEGKFAQGQYIRFVDEDNYGASIAEMEIYSKPLEEHGIFYNNQKPNVKIDLAEQKSILKVKTETDPVDVMSYLTKAYENAKLSSGEAYSTVKDAPWIAKDYNPTVVPEGAKASVINVKGEEVTNPIPRKSGVYSITYKTKEDAQLGKTQLEIIDADALDNAIKLAEEFKAQSTTLPEDLIKVLDTVLQNAKEIREKELTTYAEVDNATKDILKVLVDLDVAVGEKEKLQNLYNDALVIMENLDKYNDAGKEQLKQAVDNAKKVLDNAKASTEEISNAWTNLATAISKMELSPNKSALQLLVKEYEALDLSGYTPNSVSEFKEVMNRAKELIEDKNTNQEAVDKLVEELKSAKEQLVLKANKEELKAVITSVDLLVKDEYTKETWDNLQNALNKANTILADENASQKDVDFAKSELQVAINSLEKQPVTPPTPDKPNPDKPNPDKPNNDNIKPNNNNQSNNNSGKPNSDEELPQTADNSNGLLAGITAMLGALGLTSVVTLKRKKRSK